MLPVSPELIREVANQERAQYRDALRSIENRLNQHGN